MSKEYEKKFKRRLHIATVILGLIAGLVCLNIKPQPPLIGSIRKYFKKGEVPQNTQSQSAVQVYVRKECMMAWRVGRGAAQDKGLRVWIIM